MTNEKCEACEKDIPESKGDLDYRFWLGPDNNGPWNLKNHHFLILSLQKERDEAINRVKHQYVVSLLKERDELRELVNALVEEEYKGKFIEVVGDTGNVFDWYRRAEFLLKEKK